MRQHGAHGFADGALDTPDGETTQADTGVMGVTRQAPTATTGRVVFQRKAEGYHEGEDTCEEGLAVAKQLQVGRFIVEIDSDGAVFAWPFGCGSPGSPSPRLSGLGS
jgi:hypothetical protein